MSQKQINLIFLAYFPEIKKFIKTKISKKYIYI